MLTRFLGPMGQQVLDNLADAAARLRTPALRLGVTGLRRAGKTVFVSSLVENLLRGGALLPFFTLAASGRFLGARLQPQPDPQVPRFAVESHLAALVATPPHWPEATRGVSQVRVSLRYVPGGFWRRQGSGLATLNLDIVDYPGEWLLDLPLLHMDYSQWSAFTLALAAQPPRDRLAADWMAYLLTRDPCAPAEEEDARRAAALYTEYLHACRQSEARLSLVQPGRFVEPGEMAGAPLLTFVPLPEPGVRRPPRGSLWSLMAERYEAYREHVVRRFFQEHFARLDRQIILVDLLGALNAGEAGVADMRAALMACLEAFRHGPGSWLDWLTGPRIDRVLFAATKADHLAAPAHPVLGALLDSFVSHAAGLIRYEGAKVESMALASVRCTESLSVSRDGRTLDCVRGIPLGRNQPTVLYPGDLPESLAALSAHPERRYGFLDFCPPPGLNSDGRGLPHIRLDHALEWLIGDRV